MSGIINKINFSLIPYTFTLNSINGVENLYNITIYILHLEHYIVITE